MIGTADEIHLLRFKTTFTTFLYKFIPKAIVLTKSAL